MKISHKFRKFLAFSEFSGTFSQNIETVCHFLNISVKFRQNFIKFSPKNHKLHRKTRMKNEISFLFRQKFGRFFAKILRSERRSDLRKCTVFAVQPPIVMHGCCRSLFSDVPHAECVSSAWCTPLAFSSRVSASRCASAFGLGDSFHVAVGCTRFARLSGSD